MTSVRRGRGPASRPAVSDSTLDRADGMKVSFAHAIVACGDLAASRRFYVECLGVPISRDLGVCFTLLGDSLMLHDACAFSTNVFGAVRSRYRKSQGGGNLNLYFESEDLDATYRRVVEGGHRMVHPIALQPWSQRVFRVLDPDGHLVEIGDPLWNAA